MKLKPARALTVAVVRYVRHLEGAASPTTNLLSAERGLQIFLGGCQVRETLATRPNPARVER